MEKDTYLVLRISSDGGQSFDALNVSTRGLGTSRENSPGVEYRV